MDGHPPRSPPAAAGAAPDEQTGAAPSYLTLGDGDFSYSLDLCRFLASIPCSSTCSSKEALSSARVAAHVTCSGIDSPDEVRAKYRDADSIIRKISSLDERQVTKRREKKRRKLVSSMKRERGDDEQAGGDVKDDTSGLPSKIPVIEPLPLTVRVEHGINAIVMPGSKASRLGSHRYQHVIFNHPHIGHESAALHRRFLAHLFHTVDQHWLAPCGIFHLTLVLGQANRWNCVDTATKHGFRVLNRDVFRPPPSPPPRSSLGTETYFKSRRHQSGRSFANRSEGSETLTFGRVYDEKKGFIARHLPWQNMAMEDERKEKLLSCPHCSRSFRDERARKNHIKCSHLHGADEPSEIENGKGSTVSSSSVGKIFECKHCNVSAFTSAQALNDHVRAKHSGQHTDIKPEWSKAASLVGQGSGSKDLATGAAHIIAPSREAIGSCNVCGLSYYDTSDEAAHLIEFVPQPFVDDRTSLAEAKNYRCSHCDKRFKDTRAVRQHENFCSKRPEIVHAST